MSEYYMYKHLDSLCLDNFDRKDMPSITYTFGEFLMFSEMQLGNNPFNTKSI